VLRLLQRGALFAAITVLLGVLVAQVPEELRTRAEQGDARSIAIDVVGGKLYVADAFVGKVVQTNLDGTGRTTFLIGVQDAYGLALDGPNPCTYQ